MTTPEPRKPGRPRKEPLAVPEPPVAAADVPPGPIRLEVRVDGKIKFLQRVHSYTIDQQADKVVITGALRQTKVDDDSE